MLHRIRKCFGIENNNDLNNTVELDETYVGGKNKNRHADKKVEHSQGRSGQGKTPVFGMVERKGKLNAMVVKDTSCETLTAEVVRFVKEAISIPMNGEATTHSNNSSNTKSSSIKSMNM